MAPSSTDPQVTCRIPAELHPPRILEARVGEPGRKKGYFQFKTLDQAIGGAARDAL